jgi:hypothetical protein
MGRKLQRRCQQRRLGQHLRRRAARDQRATGLADADTHSNFDAAAKHQPESDPNPDYDARAHSKPHRDPRADRIVAGATSTPQLTLPPTDTAQPARPDSVTSGFGSVLILLGGVLLLASARTARRRNAADPWRSNAQLASIVACSSSEAWLSPVNREASRRPKDGAEMSLRPRWDVTGP